MTRTRMILLVAVVALVAPGRLLSAEAVPDKLVQALRTVTVNRSGEIASVGQSEPFPSRREKDITFAPRVKEGRRQDDGSLDLARSRQGDSLWALRKWDDGTDDANLFRVSARDWIKLEKAAVLQFVDSVWEDVDPKLLGSFGRSLTRQANGKATELFMEAWLALPEYAMIYRPADKMLYPLVPAVGKYDPKVARGVQWMSFARKCPETGGACVYYGKAMDVCKRLKDKEPDGDMWIWPHGC